MQKKFRKQSILLSMLLCVTAISSQSISAGVDRPVLAYQLEDRLKNWACSSHTVAPRGFAVSVDPEVKYNGLPCARFASSQPDQDKGYYIVIYQEFKASEYLGKHLKFSAVSKGNCTIGGANLFAKVNVDNKVIAFDCMKNREIQSSKDWQQSSLVVEVPKNSTKLTVGFCFRGSGNLLLSGLTVEAVGDDVPVTSTQDVNPKDYKFYAIDLPDKPREFNFESIAVERGPRQLLDWVSPKEEPAEFETYCDREIKLKGRDSASIKSVVPEPKSFQLIYQDISAASYLGKRLKYSVFVRCHEVKDWAAIWIRVDGVDQVLAFDNMEKRPLNGTAEFRPASVVVDVPEGAKKIRLGFMQAGTGQSWFSNCSLDPVDKSEPVTGDNINIQDIRVEKLADKPILEFSNR
jgi:hypothetical protein